MSIDLNNLPDEILFLANDEFHQFIKTCLGYDEMLLLQSQSIKNIRALLNVPDVLTVINIKCRELVDIKDRICFIDENDNNKFIVKSGIKGGIDDLIKVLKEKNNDYIQRTKRLKTSSRSSKTKHPSTTTSLLNASYLSSTSSTLAPPTATTPPSSGSIDSTWTPTATTTASNLMSMDE